MSDISNATDRQKKDRSKIAPSDTTSYRDRPGVAGAGSARRKGSFEKFFLWGLAPIFCILLLLFFLGKIYSAQEPQGLQEAQGASLYPDLTENTEEASYASYRFPPVPYREFQSARPTDLHTHDIQEIARSLPPSNPSNGKAGAKAGAKSKALETELQGLAEKEKKPFVLFFALDDAGQYLEQVEPYLSFEGRTTIAILPNTRDAQVVAKALQVYNVPYILHLPMEPMGEQDPGANAIKVRYSDTEIEGLLSTNLQSISGIIGVNNHMGSLATTDERVMRLVLAAVKKKDLFFLDSRTTANIVSKELAKEFDMDILLRDVFIDNRNDVDKIKDRIHEGIAIAKRKGHAVLIGHVTREETFIAISELYPFIKAEGGILAGLDEYGKYVKEQKLAKQ